MKTFQRLIRCARAVTLTPIVLGAAALAGLSGCGNAQSGRPAVLGAVFGLANADDAPFKVGTIPAPAVGASDRLLGQAANNPGQCIYVRGTSNRRFRADCPDGYVAP